MFVRLTDMRRIGVCQYRTSNGLHNIDSEGGISEEGILIEELISDCTVSDNISSGKASSSNLPQGRNLAFLGKLPYVQSYL